LPPAGPPNRSSKQPASASLDATATAAASPTSPLWAKPQPRAVWLTVADLLLIVEMVSPGPQAMDGLVKRQEHARAGVPQYWIVDRDQANTVTLYRLSATGDYDVTTKLPLAWLLNTTPTDHLG
jgi:Uma2 family endonuclease